MTDLDEAARFMLEVAKSFGRRSLKLYDEEEFEKLTSLYGSMNHFQKTESFLVIDTYCFEIKDALKRHLLFQISLFEAQALSQEYYSDLTNHILSDFQFF